MRTLNRPMFRYGGPIKEGVMSGIREPKRKGGSMGEPQAINTVGSPLSPMSSDGRANYAGPLLGIGAIASGIARAAPLALRYGRTGLNALKNLFGKPAKVSSGGEGLGSVSKTTFSRASQRVPAGQNIGSYTGVKPTTTTIPFQGPTGVVTPFVPNFLGRDPTVRLIGGAYKAITDPRVTGLIAKGARLVLSPTGAVTGLIYANGKYFNKKGEEVETPENAGDLKIGEKITSKSGALSGQISKAEFAEKQKQERIANYRKIMNIEGMKKDAAYDSLIDASKAVTDSQDFKGDLKSGKLINNIIQATSKQFDKPKKTEDSINALILKNQLAADTPSTKLKDLIAIGIDTPEKQEAYLRTQLGQPSNLGAAKAAIAKSGAQGADGIAAGAAELMFPGEYRGDIIDKKIFEEILEKVKKDPKNKKLRPNQIIESIISGEAQSKGYPPGKYTVPGGVIVNIDENSNATIVR
jgi:hypothetical protein